MKKEEVEQRVIKVIREKFFLSDNVIITSTTDICLELEADSLDEVELLQKLELEFDCSFSKIHIGLYEGITTVGEIVDELMKILKYE